MEKKTNKMLLIIDPQYDFIEGGKLAVEGGTKALDNVVERIEKEGYDFAIITCDWHPNNHISFKEWNPHCIQFTHGASIYEPLMIAVDKNIKNFKVLTKGNLTNKEEYSIMDNYESSKQVLRHIDLLNVSQIDICGIASEYCVLESLKGLYDSKIVPTSKLNVLLDCVGKISTHEPLISYCKEKGIKCA